MASTSTDQGVIPFIHIGLSREDAENLLQKVNLNGGFLLRHDKKNPEITTLSFMRSTSSKPKYTHVKLINDVDGIEFVGYPFANAGELFWNLQTDPFNLQDERDIELRFPVYPLANVPNLPTSSWFFGTLHKGHAHELLLVSNVSGSFLVRASLTKHGQFVLSVLIETPRVQDLRIVYENGRYRFNAVDVENQHTTVDMLVNTFHSKHLPIDLKDGTIVVLNKPLVCDWRKLLKSAPAKGLQQAQLVSEEYADLQQAEHLTQQSREVGAKPENVPKNRYKNILPYDSTRVVLKDGPDYINANFMQVNTAADIPTLRYIATQGCLSSTVVDFWRMIWQENCAFIVMLTNVVECGKNKCVQYWPEKIDEKLEFKHIGMTVLCKNIDNRKDFRITTLQLEKLPCAPQDVRTVFHYHYTAWPDKSVPKDSNSLVVCAETLNAHKQTLQSGPVVVHCSAGIGRTGTFILISVIEAHFRQKGCLPDIKKLTENVRAQRSGMVQTLSQYQFVYDAVEPYKKKRTGSLPLATEPRTGGVLYQNLPVQQ